MNTLIPSAVIPSNTKVAIYNEAPQQTLSDSTPFHYLSEKTTSISIANTVYPIVIRKTGVDITLQGYTTMTLTLTNSIKQLGTKIFKLLGLGSALVEVTTEVEAAICFPGGTRIKTDQGEKRIEEIEETNTIEGKRIVGVTRTVSLEKKLVCMEKGSLGDNEPSERTEVSRNHKIRYEGRMVKARELVGKEGIYEVEYRGEMMYNVLMEKHEEMKVNGMVCETLDPRNIVAEMYRMSKKWSPEMKERVVREWNKKEVSKRR